MIRIKCKELFDAVKEGVPCTIHLYFAGTILKRKGTVETKNSTL